MSGWGILAAGLAGGARAVGGIAEGKIDQERRLESAQAIADIEEQKQKRIAEYQQQMRRADQTYNTTGQGFDELSAAKAADARQSAALALEGKRNEATDQRLIDAQRSKARGDAEAAHETANAMLLADASNPALRKAQWDAAMNDPRTKAAYNASMASAGASAASARFDALRYAQLKEVGGVASNVRLLQDKLSKTQDPTERDSIQQQISDLGFAGKDPGKFLSVAERAQDNVAAALRAMNDPAATDESRAAAKKAMERAVELSTKAAAMAGIKMTSDPAQSGAPPVGAVVGGFTFKGGNPNDKANWEQVGSNPSLPTRKDPITGEELTQGTWDRKYGKGDFNRLYKRGEDALTGF